MKPQDSADGDAVRNRLEAAGLRVPESEVALIAEQVAALRPHVDAMYRVSETRYEEPALVFRADAPSEGWPPR
jgi:hypothetical protein